MKHGAWTIRRLRDDAGVRRRVVNPRLRRALRDAEPELRGRLLTARRVFMRSLQLRMLGVACMFGFGLLMLGKNARDSGSGWSQYSFFGLIVLLVAVIVYSWWHGSAVPNDKIRQVALDQDLCPSCAGDLIRATPDPTTGRIRCDTCGGEWAKAAPQKPAICGACRYDLRGLQPGEDGITRCPECGAGWRFG